MEISPEYLLELVQVPAGGRRVDGRLITCVEDCIPEDAKVLRCGFSESGCVLMFIESEQFPPIGYGDQVPRLIPSYTSTREAASDAQNQVD